ncbi:acetyl-CoA carboxylase biotin carboxyl carrier protein [candidate division KSB1 bacterium]
MVELKALFEFKNSRYRILSPAVGMFSFKQIDGNYLSSGAFIGKLEVLNSSFKLYLSEEVYGKIEIGSELDKAFPVEYGQELFCLNPAVDLDKNKKAAGTAVSAEKEAYEEGYVITAVSNGMFYRKSSPDSPPYVVEGEVVEKGKVLGLIEVMKTFTPIDFQGTDTSASGKIKKIYVNDSEEVKSGQPLFLIESLT